MPDPLESVNDIARRYREASRTATSKEVAAQHGATADSLQAAGEELARLRVWAKPIPASYGDLSDLPPELLKELSGVKTDELEDQIFAIVKAAGASIELDKLLIELFRRSGVVHQRRFINNKAYRMAQKELIYIVAGRKGVYTAKPQPKDDDSDVDEAPSPPKVNGAKDIAPPKEDFDLDDEIPF